MRRKLALLATALIFTASPAFAKVEKKESEKPPVLTAELEAHFCRGFSDVRVLQGTEAMAAAKTINAEAFVHLDAIAVYVKSFTEQNYEACLVAHELTHIVRQDKNRNKD